ncbi:MAG: branched-chain amino acid ABC transporter permease [Hyphomonadaceae bacterium]|nr:branched-chain amino acid ABC transporter permease [Hyphomonadaceae bacterium]
MTPVVLTYAAAVIALPVVAPSVPLATEILIFALATLGCHLLLGYGGLLSFGQGAFFGLGAYAGGLYALYGSGPWGANAIICVLGGTMVGAVAAALVGLVAIRRVGAGNRGHGGAVAFLMLTFAVAQVAYFAAYNMTGVTGGENGLLDVPRPPVSLGGAARFNLDAPLAFYAFVAGVLMLAVALLDRLVRSTAGRALIAIRENEGRAAAVGYDVARFRLSVFTLSGGLAGCAGALYAIFLGLVPLSAIDVMQSERIVVMTVLGGTGSLIGALLGTASFIMAADALSNIWPHWPLVLGVGIVLIVFFARGGLWSIGAGLVQGLAPGRASRRGKPAPDGTIGLQPGARS